MADEEYISPRDTLERLVRLETKLCIKFEAMDKALVLARELATKQIDTAFVAMNTRLEGMNEFRHQLERQESQFLRKEDLARELAVIRELRISEIKSIKERQDKMEKMFYVGLGIVLTIQVVFHVFFAKGQ